jgi:hypothetical protein
MILLRTALMIAVVCAEVPYYANNKLRGTQEDISEQDKYLSSIRIKKYIQAKRPLFGVSTPLKSFKSLRGMSI